MRAASHVIQVSIIRPIQAMEMAIFRIVNLAVQEVAITAVYAVNATDIHIPVQHQIADIIFMETFGIKSFQTGIRPGPLLTHLSPKAGIFCSNKLLMT